VVMPRCYPDTGGSWWGLPCVGNGLFWFNSTRVDAHGGATVSLPPTSSDRRLCQRAEYAGRLQRVQAIDRGEEPSAGDRVVRLTVTETERRPASDNEGPAWVELVDGHQVSAVVAEVASAPEPWPDNPPVADTTDTPITVRLLGPYEIHVGDEPVATGLRTAAKELFAWYLMRPEGATIEAAVDALWPDTDPVRVHKQFWTRGRQLAYPPRYDE